MPANPVGFLGHDHRLARFGSGKGGCAAAGSPANHDDIGMKFLNVVVAVHVWQWKYSLLFPPRLQDFTGYPHCNTAGTRSQRRTMTSFGTLITIAYGKKGIAGSESKMDNKAPQCEWILRSK
ncbi:hypothetical protein [Paenibacillus sp. Soil724D2]|uniref:hypothetical protein n=1 Tax=Paenibacillus sp. (strain Soil724D2) TaxID=1736392 RepID=UPI001F28CC52|nr:hypothetical protein [Paenibacillus sp. Soil724D2]